jgi:phage head maturation protease
MARDHIRSRDAATRMAEMPRVVPFSFVRSADGEGEGAGDGLTLYGYASVFDSETIIDSWEGRFKEQFLAGSMRKSFRELTPIIQFDHGRHPLIGSLPVASFEPGYPREEADPQRAPNGGAHVVARMHQSPLFEPVREVISTGTVNGMSIRFGVTKERWYRPDGTQVRDDKELEAELLRTWLEDVPDDELLRRDVVEASVAEMGPVVWPAYTSTSVGVRSLFDYLGADQRRALIREVAEHVLRDPSLPDLIAASGARSTGGEEPDTERQAASASDSTKSRRQQADDDALRLRGIVLDERKVTQS